MSASAGDPGILTTPVHMHATSMEISIPSATAVMSVRQPVAMIFDAALNAWCEKVNGKLVPRWTPEEYQFREDAQAKLDSGTLDAQERADLQRECVRRAQLSPHSWAMKK